MNADEMRKRTKQFALRVLKLAESLPRTVSGRTLTNQIARSGTSVAANYRAAGKARSKAEFIAKPGIAEEESRRDSILAGNDHRIAAFASSRLEDLHQEARELTAIVAASRKSARANKLAIGN